jgi:hypothetical protein
VRKEIKRNYRMKFNPINDFHFTNKREKFVKGKFPIFPSEKRVVLSQNPMGEIDARSIKNIQ